MKKSLARVKQQLADLRPGKTELLSEELQAADKRVEYLREVLQTLTKALPPPSTGDKKLKKCPDYTVYSLIKQNEKLLTTEEGFSPPGLGPLIHPVLTKYSELHCVLSEELSKFEVDVEQQVCNPLLALLETDIPKLKKNLNKHINDRDTANNRLQTAQNRHAEPMAKHNVDTSKLSLLQDDFEEAGQRVEQASDQLAVDMFTLLTHEPEVAQKLFLHIKLRKFYHENVLSILEKIVPEMDALIRDSPVKPVFNCSLSEHLRVTKRKVALPIELCICALYEHGMGEEGLFRVAAGASKLRRLKLSIDANCLTLPLPHEYKDVHLFAGVLKSYLRELPDPLLTSALFDDWMNAGRCSNEETRVTIIKEILHKLPQENYDNLRYLIKFLSELSKNSQNKMTSHNIAIVMSPNLLMGNNNPDLDDINYGSRAVDTLISRSEEIFPGETEIYLTFKRGDLFGPENDYCSKNQTQYLDSTVMQPNHETAISYSSLSENSSPKPVVRRKNKPAPEPPKIDHINSAMAEKPDLKYEKPFRQSILSGSATINRSTYKSGKNYSIDHENSIKKMSQSVTNADEIHNSTMTHVRRKSLDFDHVNNVQSLSSSSKINCSLPVNNKKDGGHTHPHLPHGVHVSKSDISQPILNTSTVKSVNEEVSFASLPPTVPTAVVNQMTAQNATIGKITVTHENLQQKSNLSSAQLSQKIVQKPVPVAAPRTFIEPVKNTSPINKGLQKNDVSSPSHHKVIDDVDNEETVELRRQSISSSREDFLTIDRGNKPTVPERPASLRPASFRIVRQVVPDPVSTQTESSYGLTMLERTVMYNVPDKQQVSIVRVKDKEKLPLGHDTQIIEKEKFLGHHPSQTQIEKEKFFGIQNQQMSNSSEKLSVRDQKVEAIQSNLASPNSESSEDLNLVLQRRQSIGSKPMRPPKPETNRSNEKLNLTKSNERINITNTNSENAFSYNSNVIDSFNANENNSTIIKASHGRTKSEGHIIDSPSPIDGSSSMSLTNSGTCMGFPPPSPRGPSRPPRPQPPPPPPPVMKPRLSTESTDL